MIESVFPLVLYSELSTLEVEPPLKSSLLLVFGNIEHEATPKYSINNSLLILL